MVQITMYGEQKKKKKFSTSSNGEYYTNNNSNTDNKNNNHNNSEIKNNDKKNAIVNKENTFSTKGRARRRSRTRSKRIITVAGLNDSPSHLNNQNHRRVSVDSQEMSLDKDLLREDLSKFTRRFLVYMILTVTDMTLGSLLFFYIEHCYDRQSPEYLPMEKTYINICKLFSSTNLFQQNNYTTSTVTQNDSQILGKIASLCGKRALFEEKIECHLDKKAFSKWFEYTASIGFTVGFGHVVTRSMTGQIVTMFYIIPTIAFTMVMYIHAANVIITIAKMAILHFETNVLGRTKVHYATAKVFLLQLAVTTTLVVGSSLFYAYNGIQEMTFVEGLYFTITSLTTIGFGDFTLDFGLYLEQVHMFVVLCFLWFFGMGMVASIVAGLSEMVSKYKFGNLAKIMKFKCCVLKVERDVAAEEEDSCPYHEHEKETKNGHVSNGRVNNVHEDLHCNDEDKDRDVIEVGRGKTVLTNHYAQ